MDVFILSVMIAWLENGRANTFIDDFYTRTIYLFANKNKNISGMVSFS